MMTDGVHESRLHTDGEDVREMNMVLVFYLSFFIPVGIVVSIYGEIGILAVYGCMILGAFLTWIHAHIVYSGESSD